MNGNTCSGRTQQWYFSFVCFGVYEPQEDIMPHLGI